MIILIAIIVLGLLFDYINGFHDAANSIATIVSTKVLTPFQAVLWAAFFNFVAFFISKYLIGDFGIANTVSKTVYQQYITLAYHIGRRHCCHYMELVYLVARYTFFFFSYIDWRFCRLGYYGKWLAGYSFCRYS